MTIGESITVWLVSSFTSLDLTASLHTNNSIFSFLLKSGRVKLDRDQPNSDPSPYRDCSRNEPERLKLEAVCTIGGRLYHWRPFVPLEAFCTFGGRLYLDYFPYTIRQVFFARVIANRVTEPRMCSELFKEEEKNFSKFSFSVIFSVRKNL